MFQAFMNLVILANTITIGVEQSYRIADKESPILDTAEHCFMVAYIGELCLQFRALGRDALHDSWVRFDLVLVIIAILTTWLIPALSSYIQMDSLTTLGTALVLRVARLARLARTLRLIKSFASLWLLVNAFLSSAKIMAFVVLVLFGVLFMFSAAALEVITIRYAGEPDMPEEIRELVEKYFRSLSSTMLTLIQFVCMDSIGAIYRPFIQFDPALSIYFGLLILVVSIVAMNIVTAVIVNSALEQGANDREFRKLEERRKKDMLLKSLYQMFRRLDSDNSGGVEAHEIADMGGNDLQILKEFVGDIDPLEIFSLLDANGTGELDINEFVDGLCEAVLGSSPLAMRRMEKQVSHIPRLARQLEELTNSISSIEHQLRNASVEQAHPSVQAICASRTQAAAEGPQQRPEYRRSEGAARFSVIGNGGEAASAVPRRSLLRQAAIGMAKQECPVLSEGLKLIRNTEESMRELRVLWEEASKCGCAGACRLDELASNDTSISSSPDMKRDEDPLGEREARVTLGSDNAEWPNGTSCWTNPLVEADRPTSPSRATTLSRTTGVTVKGL